MQNSNTYMKDVGKKVSSGNKGGNLKVFNNTTKKFEEIPTPGPITLNSQTSQSGGIISNMVAALNFLNTKSNVFPFEPPRNEAVSDFYQLSKGGGATSDDNQPNMKGIAEQVTKHAKKDGSNVMPTGDKIPFLEPSKNQRDISWLKGRGKISVSDLQNIDNISQDSLRKIINDSGIDNLGNPKN